MPASTVRRPATLLVAAGLTALAAAFMLVMGVLAVASHPGPLSAGIGAVLLVWAAILAWAARGMARARPWARGPVVAAGLLHLASFAGFAPSQPLALIPAAMGLLAVAAAVAPPTTRALHLDGSAD